MEAKINKFLKTDAAPVELLAQLNICFPTIYLNEAIGDAMFSRDVDNLIKIVPLQGAIIDITSTWENNLTHYMQAITMSNTLISLEVGGSNEEIKFLSTRNMNGTEKQSQITTKSFTL